MIFSSIFFCFIPCSSIERWFSSSCSVPESKCGRNLSKNAGKSTNAILKMDMEISSFSRLWDLETSTWTNTVRNSAIRCSRNMGFWYSFHFWCKSSKLLKFCLKHSSLKTNHFLIVKCILPEHCNIRLKKRLTKSPHC